MVYTNRASLSLKGSVVHSWVHNSQHAVVYSRLSELRSWLLTRHSVPQLRKVLRSRCSVIYWSCCEVPVRQGPMRVDRDELPSQPRDHMINYSVPNLLHKAYNSPVGCMVRSVCGPTVGLQRFSEVLTNQPPSKFGGY